MRDFPVAALCLAILLGVPSVARTAPRDPAPAAPASTANERALLDVLNARRAAERLAPVTSSAALRLAARERLSAMRAGRRIALADPEARVPDPVRRIYPHPFGEALAWQGGLLQIGFSPDRALRRMLESESDRQILLGGYREAGIAAGAVDTPNGRATVYVVLLGTGPAERSPHRRR